MTGQRVILPDGREGVVASEFRDRTGCGCRMVIVRLASGRDWLGKAAEVRPA